MEQIINSKDYSIVTACRNRQGNLLKAIDSWASINPYEIIIIDWGSDNPIDIEFFNPSIRHLIKITRFESDRWVLSWAFNEGLCQVKTKYTIKLDCDHTIHGTFLLDNPCEPFRLIRGSHRYIEEGQEYTNGAFISCSELLRKVGYFDERITTYGWDDSDLYFRLSDYMKSFALFKSNSIRHLPQEKGTRTVSQAVKKENLLAINLNVSIEVFCILRNRFLSRLFMWDWAEWNFDKNINNRFIFRDQIKVDNIIYTEIANFIYFFHVKKENFEKIGKRINNQKINEIFDLYYQILYEDFKEELIPINLLIPEIIERYKISIIEGDKNLSIILRNIILNLYKDSYSESNTLLKIEKNIQNSKLRKFSNKPKRLIVRPMHGLGNRLRVISSAYVIAEKSNRDLVICWDKDEHFKAEFYDLFEKQKFNINISLVSSKFLANIHEVSFYQYLENEPYTHKHQEINLDTDLDILIFSSCAIISKFSNYEEENKFLKSLKFSNNIDKIINTVDFNSNMVGVHIRYDGDNWESATHNNIKHWNKKSHEILIKNRNQSKPEFFLKRMKELIKKNDKLSFFISASNLSSIEYIIKHFEKEKIKFIIRPNDSTKRDLKSLEFALADILLLSKCKHILGSGWSSFTECAQRFSSHNQIVEIVGEDF